MAAVLINFSAKRRSAGASLQGMEREVNKYRIATARLKNWDYSSYGFYFITICTKNKKCFFGKIESESLIYSAAGNIVCSEWLKSAQIRNNITIDEWILMPNHLHGILVLESTGNKINELSKVTNWNKNSLGVIINQFKGVCTKKIKMTGMKDFAWQSRYYDHIIRNEGELYLIRNYIKYNHLKWKEDRYYSEL